MNAIIDFYQNLDTINLILFWGVIIVIILLLIFSIILVNKNKKLKSMLISNDYDLKIENDFEENSDIPVIKDIPINNQEKEKNVNQINDIDTNPKIMEENKFIAEEHVMQYNKELFSLPNIEKVNIAKENETIKEEIPIPNAPYQRNVLREKYSNQTSPIGIVKRDNHEEKNAEELQNILKTEQISEELSKSKNNNTYLKEVSQKLNEATNLNDIKRTAYEIKQEEDAIISYQELMAKKDSIHIADEEEAVISIEELMNRKKSEEKMYNITKEEDNSSFIDELKHFRHDL